MNLLAQCWLLAGGVVAAVYDLRERRVPNAVVVARLLAWPLFGIGRPGAWWVRGLAGFTLVGLPLFALALTAGLGMGMSSSGPRWGCIWDPGTGSLRLRPPPAQAGSAMPSSFSWGVGRGRAGAARCRWRRFSPSVRLAPSSWCRASPSLCWPLSRGISGEI